MPVRLATHEWPPASTDAGAPAPVAVLVHGVCGWWRTWWRVGPALAARGWRVVAVDLRGHGGSPPIERPVTVGGMAEDLAATIESLGLQAVDLVVAHSLGAAVALELAQRPRLVRRLVLEDPPGQVRADDPAWLEHLEQEVIAARTDPASEIRRELAENPAWLPEDARQDVEGRALCDVDGIVASIRADHGARVLELAPRLEVPALYLVADAGRSVLGPNRERLIASLPPQANAIEFDAGHVIHRDRFDAYVAAIESWMADGIDGP